MRDRSAAGPPLQGQRILLVEDEAMVSHLLEHFLTAFGCEIVGPAARIKKAVELASVAHIDGALLDLNVAGEVSYPVAEILTGRGIPFAFITGYSANRISETYRERPILQKPFLDEKLRQILTLMLSQRRINSGSASV
jgi:DNA-binding NarL/FixJ family response regulator